VDDPISHPAACIEKHNGLSQGRCHSLTDYGRSHVVQRLLESITVTALDSLVQYIPPHGEFTAEKNAQRTTSNNIL